jgi:5-(carboxyamino)imidazole ribonucleotide synthase
MKSIVNKRIGIVGGGQLGKMMVLEAKRLGFYVAILDPAADCPASSIVDEQIVASFSDESAYFKLAEKVDVITYEFEHINAAALEKVGIPVYPSVKSLKTIQNKYEQKRALQDAGVSVPRLSKDYTQDLGSPQMFKAALGSYDGKGNWVIHSECDVPCGKQTGCASRAQDEGCSPVCPEFRAIDGFFEEMIDFEMEISVIACRGIDGSRVIYPVGENIHRNSILDMTIVPARVDEVTVKTAQSIAGQVMDIFEGVGTFCVELFVTKTGDILVNEVAPRPHNSGHYSIDGCIVNQFENHIRAIVGLPLGSTRCLQPTVMVNLLGESDGKAELHGVEQAYSDNKVKVHFYGKSQSKVGRKMGHYTVLNRELETAIERAENLKTVVKVLGNSLN